MIKRFMIFVIHILDDEDVFKRLHSHFTWMLKAGALTYTETLYTSNDLLKKLNSKTVKNTIFDASTCNVPNEEECMELRALEIFLSKSIFRILLYCTLTGINVRLIIFLADFNPFFIITHILDFNLLFQVSHINRQSRYIIL